MTYRSIRERMTLQAPRAFGQSRYSDCSKWTTLFPAGQDLLVAGSGELVQALMQNDLVDSYHISDCVRQRKASIQRRQQCEAETS